MSYPGSCLATSFLLYRCGFSAVPAASSHGHSTFIKSCLHFFCLSKILPLWFLLFFHSWASLSLEATALQDTIFYVMQKSSQFKSNFEFKWLYINYIILIQQTKPNSHIILWVQKAWLHSRPHPFRAPLLRKCDVICEEGWKELTNIQYFML